MTPISPFAWRGRYGEVASRSARSGVRLHVRSLQSTRRSRRQSAAADPATSGRGYDPCDGPDDPDCCDNPHYCWILTPAPPPTQPPPTPTDTPTPTKTPTPTPTNAPATFAWLDPRPVSLVANGTWRFFTVRTRGGNREVDVIVNYTPSTSRHLEISSHDTVNRCPGSYRDTLRRSNHQRVYLAGCESGTAHVFLKSTSGRTLNNYGVTVLPVPPTPTPRPQPSDSRSDAHRNRHGDGHRDRNRHGDGHRDRPVPNGGLPAVRHPAAGQGDHPGGTGEGTTASGIYSRSPASAST